MQIALSGKGDAGIGAPSLSVVRPPKQVEHVSQEWSTQGDDLATMAEETEELIELLVRDESFVDRRDDHLNRVQSLVLREACLHSRRVDDEAEVGDLGSHLVFRRLRGQAEFVAENVELN